MRELSFVTLAQKDGGQWFWRVVLQHARSPGYTDWRMLDLSSVALAKEDARYEMRASTSRPTSKHSTTDATRGTITPPRCFN